MNLDLDKGGRAAIERMIDAYGCGTKTALADLLGISKGTLSNRFLRDTFPADYVIQCALETGASLQWLATGEGDMFSLAQTENIKIPRLKLVNGSLLESNFYLFDKTLLPSGLKRPLAIISDNNIYISEAEIQEVSDGKWVINIDGKASIRDIYLLPGESVAVKNDKISFECPIKELVTVAKVRMTITQE